MDLLCAVAVSMLPVSRGRASAVFKELRQRNPMVSTGDVLEVLNVLAERRPELERTACASARRALEAAAAFAIEPIPWFDPRYPALLNCVTDPPPVLWVRGRPEVLARPAVAIVGSRAATTYALDVGHRLAAELAAPIPATPSSSCSR